MRRLLLLALCLPIGAVGAATSSASAASTVVPPTTRPAPTTTAARPPRPPTSTTVAPTTTSTTAPPSAITLPGTDAVPPVTTPVPPKGGQISPLFAWLSVGGVVTTITLIGLQVFLTRQGRRGRWTL